MFIGATSYSLIHTLLLFTVAVSCSHSAQRHRQTDIQTDKRQYHANSLPCLCAVWSAKNWSIFNLAI